VAIHGARVFDTAALTASTAGRLLRRRVQVDVYEVAAVPHGARMLVDTAVRIARRDGHDAERAQLLLRQLWQDTEVWVSTSGRPRSSWWRRLLHRARQPAWYHYDQRTRLLNRVESRDLVKDVKERLGGADCHIYVSGYPSLKRARHIVERLQEAPNVQRVEVERMHVSYEQVPALVVIECLPVSDHIARVLNP